MSMRRRLISTQLARFESYPLTYVGELIEVGTQYINNDDGTKREIGRYVFKNDKMKYVVNGTVAIDDALLDAKIGDIVEINYTGVERTSNGFDVKQFEVFILEPEAKAKSGKEKG